MVLQAVDKVKEVKKFYNHKKDERPYFDDKQSRLFTWERGPVTVIR